MTIKQIMQMAFKTEKFNHWVFSGIEHEVWSTYVADGSG